MTGKSIIEDWIDWNEWRISAHDFAMKFEKHFRAEIRQRLKQKRTLEERINREMVDDSLHSSRKEETK